MVLVVSELDFEFERLEGFSATPAFRT